MWSSLHLLNITSVLYFAAQKYHSTHGTPHSREQWPPGQYHPHELSESNPVGHHILVASF